MRMSVDRRDVRNALVIHKRESQWLGGTQQCAFVWFGVERERRF